MKFAPIIQTIINDDDCKWALSVRMNTQKITNSLTKRVKQQQMNIYDVKMQPAPLPCLFIYPEFNLDHSVVMLMLRVYRRSLSLSPMHGATESTSPFNLLFDVLERAPERSSKFREIYTIVLSVKSIIIPLTVRH